MKAKRVNLPKAPERWTFYPPPARLPAAEYSRALLRDARKYAANPDRCNTHYDGSIIPGHPRGGSWEDTVLQLGCMVGSGWSSHSRETVAEWAGGKRWIIRETNGYSRRSTLDKLDLPESDGRLLLIGAPPKPEKGVTAWRKRWTVGRAQASGLVAVAGEGITDASLYGATRERLHTLRLQHHRAETDAASYSSEHARLLETREAVQARAARVMHLLRTHGVQDRKGTPLADLSDAEALYEVRYGRRTRAVDPGKPRSPESLHARTAEALTRHAAQDARPLAVGVRATRLDGRPRHAGPYSAPHAIGQPATAPDWNAAPRCGQGLHYVPLMTPHALGDASDAPRCVQDALSYAGGDSYALWIVRADAHEGLMSPPEAVMIDGHKAKARTLTPLERVGAFSVNGTRGPKVLEALEAWDTHEQNERRTADGARSNATRASQLAREIAQTRAVLKAWRRS